MPQLRRSLLSIILVTISLSGTFVLAAEILNLRAADNQDVDYPTVRAVQSMADQLATVSNERIKLKVYSGGQLGEEQATLEITIFGGIDISRTSMANLNSIVPETMVFSLPFLFRSTEHMRKVLDGPIGAEVLASLEPHGLIGLAFYDAGARSIYNTKRPIHTPADMEGMKIRVMNSDIFIDMMEALGANATPMAFGQVYESLALGTIDAAENNWPSFESTRHFEVASYYSVTQHVMVPEVLVMSRHRWNRLSSEDQLLVQQAAKNSVPVMRELWDERVDQARAEIVAAGVNIVDDIDKQLFVDAMKPLYAEYLKDPASRNLVERIRAVD